MLGAFRLTFQVTDVLRLRIRACEARPATAKCGGEKSHKGACADCNFLEPDRLKGGSSYRLLCAVPAYATLSYYQTIYLVFYKTTWLSYTLR